MPAARNALIKSHILTSRLSLIKSIPDYKVAITIRADYISPFFWNVWTDAKGNAPELFTLFRLVLSAAECASEFDRDE
jgi:hypothetical protein